MSEQGQDSAAWQPSSVRITFTNAETGVRETVEVQSERMTRGRIQDHPALEKYYRSALDRPKEVETVPSWPPETLEGIGKRMSLPLRTKYLFEWKFGFVPLPQPKHPAA